MNKTLLPSKGGLSGSVSSGVESVPHGTGVQLPSEFSSLRALDTLTGLAVPRVSSCSSKADELWQTWSEHIYTKNYLFI